ncbi:MAG: hypothetical protein AAF741_13405 [Bacteroidota bacterium]
MRELVELTRVVNKNKIKRIDLLDPRSNQQTRAAQLYNLLSNGVVASEEEAFSHFEAYEMSKSAFSNLKASLRSKLLNTLFFIDTSQPSYNNRQSAYYHLQKSMAAASILMAKQATRTAVTELKKICKQALQYEFTDLILFSARQLSLHYAIKEGALQKFSTYQQLVDVYSQVSHAEAIAEAAYCDLIVQYVNRKQNKTTLYDLALEKLDKLNAHDRTTDSYGFRLYYYLIELFKFTCINDYAGALPTTVDMISYFRSKDYDAFTPIQIALHHQMIGYLQVGNDDASLQALLEGQSMLEVGSFNWFKNCEYQFLLAMHTGKYTKALESYVLVVNHVKFKNLPTNVREVWTIYHAYVQFLLVVGKAECPEGEEKHFTTFRINRFINELPLYSKDKSGMNTAIIIAQILFYLQKQKFDQVIDRIEAIEKYCSRYLVKSDLVRVYYFIKLLMILPKAGFNRKRATRYAERHYEKLQAYSLEKVRSFHKLEIIPFEKLWDITLEMLFDKAKEFRTK